MDGPATALLYLDHPAPKTVMATVTAVRSGGFVLDRTVFRPGGGSGGHVQPADRGEVWFDGSKRWLRAVDVRGGALLHRADGFVPKTGARVRCHLDVERRRAHDEAHTAMHLVLSALARQRQVEVVDLARVQGGRQFTLTVRRASFSPQAVASALAEASDAVAADVPVTVEHRVGHHGTEEVPAGWAAAFVAPPEGPARVVRAAERSAWACDGTFVPRTGTLGRIVLASHRPGPGGVALRFKAVPRTPA